VESSCECGNEPSGSIKCWETTEWLHNVWPLERYSAPQSELGFAFSFVCDIIYSFLITRQISIFPYKQEHKFCFLTGSKIALFMV
jgi:hypothetical protein